MKQYIQPQVHCVALNSESVMLDASLKEGTVDAKDQMSSEKNLGNDIWKDGEDE